MKNNQILNLCYISLTATIIYGMVSIVSIKSKEVQMYEQSIKAQVENQKYWQQQSKCDGIKSVGTKQ